MIPVIGTLCILTGAIMALAWVAINYTWGWVLVAAVLVAAMFGCVGGVVWEIRKENKELHKETAAILDLLGKRPDLFEKRK